MTVPEDRALARQVMSFLATGVLASGTHIVLYSLLVAGAVLGPTLATIVGFVAGTFISYALNRRFTFAAQHSTRTLVRFWTCLLYTSDAADE